MSDERLSISDSFRTEMERTLQRGLKGLEYLSTSAPPVGVTRRDLIRRRGTMALYHYSPLAEEIYRVPVLMVMALTNRGYILDLAPGQSFVEFLLKRGHDVYMIDWNPPRADEKRLRIEDYVLDFIPDCVRHVQQHSGESDVNVVGYCMGGLLTSMYMALHADGPVRAVAVFTTPIDFTGMQLFQNWTDKRHFNVDRLVDTVGNVPREIIFSGFDMLRPADRVAGQIQLWDNMWNSEYVKSFRRFEKWTNEILPLPGEFFRQFTKELMWENKLLKGELMLGKRRVDLGAIKAPLLHAVAEHDHIIPYQASKALVDLVGSDDKEEIVLKGGHVSLVAGGNAIKRLWPKLDAWLGARST
jgi:polyhydroxyalkanoate synthase subunit PhaC